jgi:hypothetical protein
VCGRQASPLLLEKGVLENPFLSGRTSDGDALIAKSDAEVTKKTDAPLPSASGVSITWPPLPSMRTV